MISLPGLIIGQVHRGNNYTIDFETEYQIESLFIDTISNPDNIWQIGRPSKALFNSAYSVPNAIITDSADYYPTNDTSVFVISNTADLGLSFPSYAVLNGYYKVQSDSLNDFGLIEFSPDNSNTWINLIEDTIYGEFLDWYLKPTLTGNSNGWKEFWVSLSEIGTVFNINYGDTIKYRFTFISDEKLDSLEGLMFDDIKFVDVGLGIKESGYNLIFTKVYPNPASNSLIIEFDNPENKSYQLTIYDSLGRPILLIDDLSESQIVLDIQDYDPGLYYYILLNEENRMGSWGKFLVE